MSSGLLDETVSRQSTPAAQRLRTTMAAVRVSIQWFGTRKTLTREQKAEAADTFGAEGAFLSAGKKLLDTSHPAFKAVTAVRGRILSLWKAMSLPYPGAGHPAHPPGPHRRRSTREMQEFREELAEAVGRLDRALRRAEVGGPAAAGVAVQRGRLPRVAAGPVRRRRGIFPRWNRPVSSATQPAALRSRSASGCSPVSTRPCGWPRRRSPPNWPSWSPT